jgi:hypothetical protein
MLWKIDGEYWLSQKDTLAMKRISRANPFCSRGLE